MPVCLTARRRYAQQTGGKVLNHLYCFQNSLPDGNMIFKCQKTTTFGFYFFQAIVLEGKYWKRKLAAVTAEYKKWRMYYRNNALGHSKDPMDTVSAVFSALNYLISTMLFCVVERLGLVELELAELGRHAHDGRRRLSGVDERHVVFDDYESAVCVSRQSRDW